MTLLFAKLRTVFRLGISNVVRVAVYRFRLKYKWSSIRLISSTISDGDFFREQKSADAIFTEEPISIPESKIFGWMDFDTTDGVPNWHRSVTGHGDVAGSNKPWWEIPDFGRENLDIKTVWELSRFDWVLGFAQRGVVGNTGEISLLNKWLRDWCEKNPPYLGPNWKCGQEASIRTIHLVVAAMLLQQDKSPEPALVSLIKAHLKRIAPTIHYAVAQNNNHGTSEAAALFIGGSFLAAADSTDRVAAKWQALGRKWLEDRVSRLIENDGSFSQYSVNYHRLVLDTLCVVEIWREQQSLPEFSKQFYARCRKATEWLLAFTQQSSGGAPNMGTNDGARLIPLTATDYRDFRPTVHLACSVFCSTRAFAENDECRSVSKWFQLSVPEKRHKQIDNKIFDDGGFVQLANNQANVYLRYPRFRFRPGQSDLLHLDLWLNDVNWLRDGGTYSYNADLKTMDYFSGVASHNTVQFDGRNQMPRLGRFLFGDWPKTVDAPTLREENDVVVTSVSYRDYCGSFHKRSIELTSNNMRVVDEVAGFEKSALLRWRLKPGRWGLSGCHVKSGQVVLSVNSSVGIKRLEVVEGQESLYYQKMTELPVLEVEIDKPGRFETVISW